MKRDYLEIIDLPHHTSATHPRMPNIARAAQFSPFSALKGYEEAIEETERFTEQKIILSDDEIKEINYNLQKAIKSNSYITITFFIKDKSKDGGEYITETSYIKKIDPSILTMGNGRKIPIEDIYNIVLEEDP